MKLQIVQLEPHDDQVSARDKMRAAKAGRLLLIWPRHGRILSERLDIALLRKEAETLGLQLGLLTHDPAVRDHARREGIPVFDDPERLPEDRWSDQNRRTALIEQQRDRQTGDEEAAAPSRRPSEQVGDRTSKWQRLVAAGLALLALAALLAALVPSATIHVSPGQVAQRRTIHVRLDPESIAVSSSGLTIPARVVEATTSGADRLPSSGTQQVPQQPANGILLFSNLTSDSVLLPAGTSVRPSANEDLYFVTLEEATLPAQDGAEVSVPAEAAVPGPDGNVAAGAVDAVDGPLGLNVTVTNPEPFEGGSSGQQRSVRQSDLDRLRAKLMAQLHEGAADTLSAQLVAGERLAMASIAVKQVVRQAFDAQPGDLDSEVGVELEADLSSLAYRASDAHQAAAMAARRTLPTGWAIVPGSLSIEDEASRALDDDTVELELTTRWARAVPADKTAIAAALRGLTPEEAQRTLARSFHYPGGSIEMWPVWLPRLPWIAARIHVLSNWAQE